METESEPCNPTCSASSLTGEEDDDDEDAAFAAELEACMDSDETEQETAAAQDSREAEASKRLPDLLTILPEEILARILHFLPNATLLNSALRRTNRRFGKAVALASIERAKERLRQSLEDGFAADALAVTSGGRVGKGATFGANCEPQSCGAGSSSDVETGSRERGRPSPNRSGASHASSTCGRLVPSMPPMERERLESLASQLEIALRACGTATFRSKYRQLVFNLRDPKNPQLRKRLLTGELAPDALLQLSGREMASVELQQQRSEWKKKRQRECVRERPLKGFVTDLYRCDRCDCTQAAVHRAIRAGQRHVDRARTYATCTECNHRWEV